MLEENRRGFVVKLSCGLANLMSIRPLRRIGRAEHPKQLCEIRFARSGQTFCQTAFFSHRLPPGFCKHNGIF